jgi:hypothetical protein
VDVLVKDWESDEGDDSGKDDVLEDDKSDKSSKDD